MCGICNILTIMLLILPRIVRDTSMVRHTSKLVWQQMWCEERVRAANLSKEHLDSIMWDNSKITSNVTIEFGKTEPKFWVNLR